MEPDHLFDDDDGDDFDPEEDARLVQQYNAERAFRRPTREEFAARVRHELRQGAPTHLPTDEEQVAAIYEALKPENQQRIQEAIHGAVETKKQEADL